MAIYSRKLIIPLVTAILIFVSACSLFSKKEISNENIPLNSNDSSVASEQANPDSTGTIEDNFPLPPDPISVDFTIDPAHTAKGSNVSFISNLEGEDSKGIPFNIFLFGNFYTKDTEGNLLGAFDTEVTVTPITEIEGLPFSKGFLTAVQIGPEGLVMAAPGELKLHVAGNVFDSNIVGFAADGNGNDFRLFPITGYYDEYSDTTIFGLNVMHYGVYGVAEVVAGEIETQLAHPPVDPGNQDENELAPLFAIKSDDEDLVPLLNKQQLQLTKSYNRLVKPGMDTLASTKCEQVPVATYNFNAWVSKVSLAELTEYFQEQIDRDAKSLHERFVECGKESCPVCMGDKSGGKSDTTKVSSMITLATFAELLAFEHDFDDVSYWNQLGNKCRVKSGFKPSFSTGGNQEGEGPVMTPTPFACQ
jgi:hypothetical protein